MATTVQQILTAAYAKSTKNRPGTIATENTELLQTVYRAMAGLFAFAARVNPTYFAKSSGVVGAGAPASFARPADAESIFRIETNTGAEVAVVPYFDKSAESGMPAVYRIGQQFISAGNAGDPAAGVTLTFFYSKRPDVPATLASTIDPLWNEQYNELLVLEVAIYLAAKDGRMDEVQQLVGERNRWVALFVAFLEHETSNERRRFGHLNRINTNTLMPLLASGAAVEAS